MNVVKLSLIALAVAAASSQLAVAGEQQESKGFIADSTLNLLNRNFWMQRDYRNSTRNTRDEWAHGIQAHYVSGFTQGTVGFGVDAHGYGGIKLDGGRGSVGNGILPVDGEGRIEDNTGELGGAVKLRVSSTVLKFGEQRPTAPVFATGDSRLLPETATGFQLSSSEFDALSLEAGHFTAINRRNSSNSDGELTSEYAEVEARSVDFVGGTYNFTDNLSVALYGSEAEDVWRQYFANVYYTIPLAEEQSLNFYLNAYKTDDQVSERGGKVDNTIFSLAGAYSFGAHTVTLAYQQADGDTAYAYGIDGNGTVWLANATTSEFWTEDERSLQARYDIDMTSYGVPGLSFMARYISGWNATVREDGVITGTDGKEHELGLQAKYVIQEGAAKDLSFRVAHNLTRSDKVAGAGASTTSDVNEVRIFIDYPLDVL